MNGKVAYHQQVSYCGKPRCRKCRDGQGHGPYWYAYKTENGRTTRTYIGKQLPPGVQSSQIPAREAARKADDNDRTKLRIYTFGQYSLERRVDDDWQRVTDAAWQQQRTRMLLALLLTSPGRKLGREQVMDAIWPDLDFETAVGRLDRTVHTLRQTLEPGLLRPASSQLLRTEREGLVLADQGLIWIDIEAFESLINQAHELKPNSLEREKALDDASRLYVGDLLPEEHQASWVIMQRDLLKRKWMSLLLDLADLQLARQAFTSVTTHLDRLLAVDATNEAAVQRLIVALTELGRRAEAMRAYHRFADALHNEYGIAPLKETLDLYEAAQQGSHTSLPPLQSQNAQDQAPEKRSRAVQVGRIHQRPLIGREQELNQLYTILTSSRQNERGSNAQNKKVRLLPLDSQRQPQCVFVVGEAGIGKTRLAEELGRKAQSEGWAIAWSRVYAQERNVPYRLWTEVLRNAESRNFWTLDDAQKRPLLYQPLSALLPELHNLPQVDYAVPPSPEQEQLRLWEAALSLLTTISERKPLLIVLDDLHWADASSCELLAYLIRHLHQRAIMVVATYRENELEEKHPLRLLLTHLLREHVALHVPIEPLTDAQIASLVDTLPGTMVEYIQTKAAGNPFFAEELARGLTVESERRGESTELPAVSASGPRPTVSAAQSAPLALPDTIAAVLNLRIGQLSTPCQRLLNNAAVLGGAFEFKVIQQMEGKEATEDDVLDLVEEGLTAGVLTEEGTGSRVTYHFWHPLLVNHLYEQLSGVRRSRLHRRAAEIYEQTFAGREEEVATLITDHLLKGGGDPRAIVRYAEQAGDRAYALSAYPEAERYYRLAATHLEEANPPKVATWNEADRVRLAYLLEQLGECVRVQGNFEETRQLYERVLEVRSYPRTFASLEEAQQEAQIDALIWREIGLAWRYTGNIAKAQECCDRGEQVLRDARIEAGPVWASLRYQQSSIYWQQGDHEKAFQTANEALKTYEKALQNQKTLSGEVIHKKNRLRLTLEGDPADLGRIHFLLGTLSDIMGNHHNALKYLNKALTIFEQHNCQRDIAHVSCNLGDVYLRSAQYHLAQAAFRQSLSIAEEVGDSPLISVIYSNMGVLAMRLGNLLEAEDWLSKSIVLAEQFNDREYMSLWNAALAIVLHDQGKYLQARKAIYLALKIGRSMQNIYCIGFALVALGYIYISYHKHFANIIILKSSNNRNYYINKAGISLKRALNIESLDAETRIGGQLALTEQLLHLNKLKEAQHLVTLVLNEANQHEQQKDIALAHRLLGNILLKQSKFEAAKDQFEQSIKIFRLHNMQLEYARAIYNYGVMLLQINPKDMPMNTLGISYIDEASAIFKTTHAALESQEAERVLTKVIQHK